MLFDDADASDLGDHVGQLVNRDQAILAQVEGLAVVRLHQFVEAGHAVIDVTKRAGLLSVTPDLHYRVASQLGHSHLATQSRWRFLSPSLPGSQGAKDVMKAHDAGIDPIVFTVVQTEPLGDQLLPAIR